ncbi:MAG TPA: tripartite tricarboxylate transporter substrate-binding protein, partial [Xanthobacteraceae bacterium]
AGVAVAAGAPQRSLGQPAAENFFRGKSIRLLVGTTPGAGYDLVARLLATHMSRHIPGNPGFVVENMAGAGSLTMMNYLYNRAPRDGTVMGVPLNGVVLEPTLRLLSRNGGAANFDIDRMSWVGSTTQDAQVLWFRTDSGIKTIGDLTTTKSIVGASAPGADNFTVTVLTNRLLGARMELVRGYQGTNDIFLAVERGEAQGSATAYSAIVSGRPQWLADGRIRLLLQYGTERLPELPDVPTALEVTRDDEIRQMLRFFGVKFKTTYPFVLPQEVPAERVAALQAGFDATMGDPAFAADMKKSNIPLRPVSGQQVQRLIRETYAAPAPMLERLREAVTP